MKHANNRRGAAKVAVLRTLALAWLLLLASPAAALNPDILPSQHFVQTWGAKEGLPGNTIWSIHQTRDGFLWLGSNSGLIVFDGDRFEVLTRETVPELVSGDIRKIAESPQGDIWLATYGGGAVRYRNGQFFRFGTEHGLTSEVVNTVYVTHGGTVWAGTSRGACQLVRGTSRFECFGKDDGLIGERVVNVAEDGNGRVWFASLDNGVSLRRDDGSFVHYGVADGLDQASVFMVTRDEELGMFFGTYGGTYFQADAQGIVPAAALAPLQGVEPIIALRDRDRQLWVGSPDGLWRAGQQPSLLLNNGGAAQVFGLIEDNNGNLWAGSTGGLHSIRTPLFTHWGKPEGASDAAYVLSANADGSVFIGTERSGLLRLDPARDKPVQVIPDLFTTVTALAQDAPGRVWAGTYGRGLTLIDNNVPDKTFSQADGLASDHITALLKGQRGVLWVGAIGGFSRLMNGAVDRTITQEDGLPESMVRHISQEADGDLLLATDSGLAQLNPTTMEVIQVYNRDDGLNSNVVATTLVDEQGTVWIGMRDGGLARLKDGRLTQFTATQGVDIVSVMTIVLDRRDHLWLAGRNGVARVSRQDLNELAAGRRSQVPVRSYSDRDGLRSMRIPGGYQSAGVLGSDGKVWLATDRGAVAVDPAQVKAETPIPNIHIRALRVDGVRQPLGISNEIPAGSRLVEIDYAAPALHDAARLRFSYRLGDEAPWMEAGDRRTAIFTSLPPRRQEFQVRAYFHGEPRSWFDEPAEGG
ncbi:MAG: two-component regulator propeller domain-containing protein, partial [Pseudomonadota bacterium]